MVEVKLINRILQAPLKDSSLLLLHLVYKQLLLYRQQRAGRSLGMRPGEASIGSEVKPKRTIPYETFSSIQSKQLRLH